MALAPWLQLEAVPHRRRGPRRPRRAAAAAIQQVGVFYSCSTAALYIPGVQLCALNFKIYTKFHTPSGKPY
jgi:hypothetical protein